MTSPRQARTGGQILVEALERNGTERIFCVPGESFLAVLDALHDSPIRVTVARQEGGAAMMAEATGKLTGLPGIAIVTRGPGATNAAAGLHIAMQDSTPMILFIGQVGRSMREREAFQEIDYRRMFGSVVKWVAEIDEAERIPEFVSRAFHVATSGRPGPVVLALPEDMLRETAAPTHPEPFEPIETYPGLTQTAQLQKLLWAAERPLVILGGARWSERAVASMRRFAERDEGIEPEERPPTSLLERAAFRIDLTLARAQALQAGAPSPAQVQAARAGLSGLDSTPDAVVEALCAAAAAFGIGSVRAPLMAVRAARAHAALCGRTAVTEADAVVAARLVLAPLALTRPTEAEDPPPDSPDSVPDSPPPPDSPDSESPEFDPAEAELLLAAVQAALPPGLLEGIVLANARGARAPRRSGSGEAVKSSRRGRPVGSRIGALRSGDRLNLPETLRTAAPWQRLRQAGAGAALIRVRPEDFRIRRFVQKRESTTIFVVDASGSAALQRLAEAKGAVELLLAKAYVSRARVALIAFRGATAETLLAPTRSLTRARRSLADLPGGGGTPLALAFDAAVDLALAENARDRTPLIVMLTDGRANIARDGAPGRAAAEADALAAAARLGASGFGCAYLDTSPRPAPGADRFARAMGATYAPLPYADATRVSGVVDDLRSGKRG